MPSVPIYHVTIRVLSPKLPGTVGIPEVDNKIERNVVKMVSPDKVLPLKSNKWEKLVIRYFSKASGKDVCEREKEESRL